MSIISIPASSPFDAMAAEYDTSFTHSLIGVRMRHAVWRRLDARFQPNDHILELNCGTGEDAIHLAQRGLHILATDVSSTMLEVARAKAAQSNLTDRIEFRPLAISMALEVSGRARILRTLRGNVRPGERDAYIEQARLGYLADIEAGHGPLAIHLGTGSGDDDFVTLSVWESWSAIEAATGGDVRRPMATRHPELIIAWEATHLEIIEE